MVKDDVLEVLSLEKVNLLEGITEKEIVKALEEGRKDADACNPYLYNVKGSYANDNHRNY